jgi:hypothetical protein
VKEKLQEDAKKDGLVTVVQNTPTTDPQTASTAGKSKKGTGNNKD